MVLGKKNSLLLTVALSLIFCFSIPCSAENDLAVTFGDNSGIWLYNALSGDWQGTWTSQAGYYTSLNGSGGLWAHFDVAPSGDFTGGVYLTNTTSGSIYQDITGENNSDLVGFGNNQDLAFDMDFRRGVISGNTITGDFEVQSRMYPVYHGSYTLNRRTWGSQITPSTPENIVSSDDRIFADFGTGGLWMRNGTVWTMLTPSNPIGIAVAN